VHTAATTSRVRTCCKFHCQLWCCEC
jgi:hypothetical protein